VSSRAKKQAGPPPLDGSCKATFLRQVTDTATHDKRGGFCVRHLDKAPLGRSHEISVNVEFPQLFQVPGHDHDEGYRAPASAPNPLGLRLFPI
jgi:hypothetical protein